MSAGKEVVFSVEETNKIRADIGLKPLEINDDDDKNDDGTVKPGTSKMENDVLVAPVNPSEMKRSEEARVKLSTAKDKRKLLKKLNKVKLLSEVGDEDEGAAAWIKKSRSKLNQAKLLAQQKEMELAEIDAEFDMEEQPGPKASYTSKDLAGIKIVHNKSDINEGSHVVLTLADSNVLGDDDDELENVNIKEDSMYKLSNENKKGVKSYKGYEEDELDEFNQKKEKNVLSKYDNIDIITGEEKKESKGGFALDGDGGADLEREREAADIRDKIKKQTQSLETELATTGTDFYTTEEMSQFKKKKRRKVRKPKKKKMLTADDLLPMDEEEESSSKSHGSRKAKDTDAVTGGASLSSAADAVAALGSKPKPNPKAPTASSDTKESKAKVKVAALDDDEDDYDMDMDAILDDGPDFAEDEAEAEIQATIERSRKVALKKKKAVSSDQQIANAVRKITTTAATEGGGESDIVMTTMQEFVQNVGRNDEAEEDKKKVKTEVKTKTEVASSATTAVATNPDAMEVEGANASTEDATHNIEEGSNWTKVKENEDDKDDDNDDDVDDAEDWKAEATVSRSIMASVAFSQLRGFLEVEKAGPKKRKPNSENLAREERRTGDDPNSRHRDRDRDRERDPLHIEGYKPTIKLEYRDDSGRLLEDQKERFRYISHKFHGKGSGKKKQEKRMNKQTEMENSKKMDSGDTPLGATAIMRKRMQDQGQAHVVIQGSEKHLNPKKKRKKTA